MEHDAHESALRDIETWTEERVTSATTATDPVSRKGDPVHSIRILEGDRLPVALGQMRYDKYIREQSKAYPTADHRGGVLYDEADPYSIHILCHDDTGTLASALRLTPMVVAQDLGLFRNFLARCDASEASVILSRLVRRSSMAGTRSIRPVFKFTYDFCLRKGWPIGLLHSSPRLLGLFQRYGWRKCGRTFHDEFSGMQVPLSLDARDTGHLEAVRSPYLAPADHTVEALEGSLHA